MVYPFPGIASDCPLCHRACGAIYRGYYRRWGVVPEAPLIGWIAIRTAYCRYHRCRFALFPEFLVPFRAFSRQAFCWLVLAWRQRGVDMVGVVDTWFAALDQEVYLAVSTLYSQLRFITRELRLGFSRFGVVPFFGTSVWDLKAVDPSVFEVCIPHSAFGLGASSRIDPPP